MPARSPGPEAESSASVRFYIPDSAAPSFSIQSPKHLSTLHLVDDFAIHLTHKKPNWFWRTMQWCCFGFRWEDGNDVAKS